MSQHRIARSLVLIGALALAAAAPVLAQEKFPSGPIQVVIHSAYGGGTDVTAQMMAIQARKELDTDMMVVPKRGGSGAAAHKYAMERQVGS